MTTVTGEQTGLSYLGCEVSYGSRWVNLNDQSNYKIAAQSTRDATQKTWRKVTAQSPILGGTYLVHAVPEMMSEQISVWVYGSDQTEVSDNLFTLLALFEQYDYRVRWTFDEYREYWRCQLADATIGRGQVWTHSLMASVQFTIPRYPDVDREYI